MFLSRQKRQTLAGSPLQTNATGSRQQTGTPAYMDALGKLDAGDARLDPEFAAKVVARIRKEFPAVQCLGSFLGILAQCHIDDTYDVHTLDWKEDILQHYHRGEAFRRDLPRDAAWHSTGAMPSWRCTRTAAGGLSRWPCGRDP
jgi:hypothetical protein